MFHTIVRADARSMPLADATIDLVLADPPYGIDYQSAWRKDKTQWRPKIANDTAPFVAWLPEAYRVLRTPGVLVVFCRWDTAEVFKTAIESAGFRVKSQIIWDRVVHGMGDLRGSFAPCHDILWFATKGRYVFPGTRPKSVISVPRISGFHLTHPNEKPVALYRWLVTALSVPDTVVLDPFIGSGACGEACRDRTFIGLDCDEHYVALARRRLEKERERERDVGGGKGPHKGT